MRPVGVDFKLGVTDVHCWQLQEYFGLLQVQHLSACIVDNNTALLQFTKCKKLSLQVNFIFY